MLMWKFKTYKTDIYDKYLVSYTNMRGFEKYQIYKTD